MAYALPSWLSLDPAKIRVESGLLPHQLVSEGTDETMEATIAGHIATCAARVLGKAGRASAGLVFPSTDAGLQAAFPSLAAQERTDRINQQQETIAECIKAFVIAKLWYSCGPPDSTYYATADGHWKTASQLETEIVKQAVEIRKYTALRGWKFL